jgi:ring-1,2-phenylacetyl-CoA epoxidase subunit PaaC
MTDDPGGAADAPADLGAPGDLSKAEREAVETLLYRLADDEFVTAERYTEWQVRAPTLESDLALSNVAQDELGHARLWYDLLRDWGATESELIWERPADEWHHSVLTEPPYEEGDWADAVVRNFLYDTAEDVRLRALEDSSYPRIRDRVGKILDEEEYHLEHAHNWMERLAEESESRERLQATVTERLPQAITVFAPVDDEVEARIDDLGLRTESLAEMHAEFLDRVVPYLESIGIHADDAGIPSSYDADLDAFDLPDAVGRDRTHTDDWDDLHAEFTRTYRELGRSEAARIMPDPDEAEG